MRYGIITVFFCTFFAVLTAQDLDNGVLFRYDFSRDRHIKLHGNAKFQDGALVLDGKTGYATVPQSEKMHAGKNGMTLAAAVKIDYDPNGTSIENLVDMFISKHKEFLFGKHHENLYANFHDVKSFSGYTVVPATPEPGKWVHVAAVFEYFNDQAQGDVGTRVNIYKNGELETSRKFLYVKIVPGPAKIELGSYRNWGTPWFMKGAIGSAVMYDRPLNAAEIAELCKQEKRVKAVRKGFYTVPAELQSAADIIMKEEKQPATWCASAILRAAVSGTDSEKLQKMLQTIRVNRDITSLEKFAKKCNSSQSRFRIFLNDDLAAFILNGKGKGSHPVIGVLNRKTGHELFGERSIFWEIPWRKEKKTGVISANTPDITWESTLSKNTLKVTWTGTDAIPFSAVSIIRFNGPAMESTFEVINKSGVLFDSVRYPMYSFASMGKDEKLLHPFMSGILVENPMTNRYRHGQTGTYPSGRVAVQFGALFNSKRQGIYFGYEDGKARTKVYTAEGKRNNMQVTWENPLIAELSQNNFKMNGKAVVRFYEGEWYEAGQIYRKFLEKEADWWIKKLPRKSTPDWFRNNALWIRLITDSPKKLEEARETVKYLRTYFEMPFGVHWYEWNDDDKLGWPHFPPKKETPEVLKEFNALGIRVIPYIDSRLWEINDGPNHTDYMYRSHGLKYAVRDRNNNTYTENYGINKVYSVMCPVAPGWQRTLSDLIIRLSDDGFAGAYHDQMGTGRPIQCFNTAHGHAPNDPDCWLEPGYRAIFKRIFDVLHVKNREFCHTTEENAEPYMKQLDGCLVPRWTENEQVPLFQSIYSGRIQFVGRLYNCMTPGAPQSFFTKAAQQLVNAEQIGWCQPAELRHADERRKFLKKCAFARKALLYWFNEGRMLAPVNYGDTMKYERCVWSGYVPQMVKMPCIASSAWEGPDGSRMFLFVNDTGSETNAVPAVQSTKGFWVCREGKTSPVFVKKAPELHLPARTFEVWVEGSRKQADAIQMTLKKIAGFDCGESAQMRFKYAKISVKGVPGKYYGVKESAGNLFCNPSAQNTHFGWMQDGALIAFGEIDFGTAGAKKITVKVAVDHHCEGGTLQILTAEHGKNEAVAGSVSLKDTGGWTVFQEIPVKMNRTLKGKHNVLIRINGNNACNFAGWKFEN